MKTWLFSVLLCATLPLAAAAPPPDAPAGTTALCKDGSYFNGAEKKGACRGHKGVKDWYGAPAAAAMPAPASMPAKAMPAAPASAAKKQPPQPAATAAPGGGPGLVWVNEKTRVYHCEGDRWYGKTKEGAYMKEADAKAKGFKGPHGKDCKA